MEGGRGEEGGVCPMRGGGGEGEGGWRGAMGEGVYPWWGGEGGVYLWGRYCGRAEGGCVSMREGGRGVSMEGRGGRGVPYEGRRRGGKAHGGGVLWGREGGCIYGGGEGGVFN